MVGVMTSGSVCTLPSDKCSAIGQLSGIALTTCFIPAWTAACAGHTCVADHRDVLRHIARRPEPSAPHFSGLPHCRTMLPESLIIHWLPDQFVEESGFFWESLEPSEYRSFCALITFVQVVSPVGIQVHPVRRITHRLSPQTPSPSKCGSVRIPCGCCRR